MGLGERLRNIANSVVAPPSSPEMTKAVELITQGSCFEQQVFGYDRNGQEKCRVLIPAGKKQYKSYLISRNPNDNNIAITEEPILDERKPSK